MKSGLMRMHASAERVASKLRLSRYLAEVHAPMPSHVAAELSKLLADPNRAVRKLPPR